MKKVRKRLNKRNNRQKQKLLREEKHSHFPPAPATRDQIEEIVNRFCIDTSPDSFEESGCAVCGQLKPLTTLSEISSSDCDFTILNVAGVTRRERRVSTDRIDSLEGPVIDPACRYVCSSCLQCLRNKKIPKNALAKGLWIGDVPDVLKGLTFSEKMMIARVRHNRCLIRVSSGRAKMTANVIMFSNPTLKVYQALPPSREEMKEVLAVIFTGSAQPTDEDFKRTPFLVRRDKVSRALDWLKLNHADYWDLEISRENLNSYPLSGVPVVVSYKKMTDESNKIGSAMSMHDDEEEEGTEEGTCPFTVHGLSGDEFSTLSMSALKARALKHLEEEGKTLGVGHDDKPVSMYDNPQAYPQMFPWLFPYGYGGIGQVRLKNKMSESEHKKCLLMYHDKRFQTDLYFPIVAFNHAQMKAGSTGSFLLVKRQKFSEIKRRLMSLNRSVLSDIIERLANDEHVRPETDEEKVCYRVLEDLEHAGGHVQGSLASKKYMRNEIWSLISFLGAPSWFITLSPADNRHPICLYFADTGEKFSPALRTSADRNKLIATNPVAAARFFDLMVRSFIKNVLGVESDHTGLYGKTSGYYGTVEQQGRLTLHLHLLLWIEGALSPQEIRDKLMSEDSQFQKELIDYLESAHQGEFHTGSMEDVRDFVPMHTEVRGGIHAVLQTPDRPGDGHIMAYTDPTQTLPRCPPSRCGKCPANNCETCKLNTTWWDDYYRTVDDLLLKSNVHRCVSSQKHNDRNSVASEETSNPILSKAKRVSTKQGPKGCIDKNGVCRARFPRTLYKETEVDISDGHINMKKKEAYLNTFTPCVTYLFRSNTDVTSLLSGTSIKAIVSYISDYVTKPSLKTHQIFSSMYDIFERNETLLAGNEKGDNESSRLLILKIVNALSAKMEMGSPMASMYLLGNPDHYTGHCFAPFWWKCYVDYIWKDLHDDKPLLHEPSEPIDINENSPTLDKHYQDRVKLGREDGVYFATTYVDDYKYRPDEYEGMTLYEWIQCAHRRRASKREIEAMKCLTSSQKTSSEYLPFKEGHPMRSTHLVKCNFDRMKTVVPNIIGGPLPRSDRGDRNYYCCTMLTLFHPWRTKACLKQNEQTWESAFVAHEFSSRQKQIMRNFNLRYECLDARDDFHSQMKKKSNWRGVWYNKGDTDEEYSDDDYIKSPVSNRIDRSILGNIYLSSLGMMNSISATLKKVGWLDRSCNVITKACDRIYPDYLPGSAWSNIVKNHRDALFRKKFSSYHPPHPDKPINSVVLSKNDELVRVLPAEYFRNDFRVEKAKSAELINNTVAKFSLNKEQERAFRIVANHASTTAAEQLKMYLGGIGGTGKSRVFKALIDLFELRKESHRFVVLAPTGTAAALLNGSTYHKALGIQRKGDIGEDFSKSESSILNEARARLTGVEYILIDEVSMIACHELYSISARLAQITGKHEVAFGGMNIIFAGDFAQLPPVFGAPLYEGINENFVNSRMSVRTQETVIGKVLWHQVTTVVILKQNMRQKKQTEDDAKLRTALINMRYAACTRDDITFLQSRIAGQSPSSPRLSDSRFRYVSIITARNNQRDRINEEGSRRFAEDHGVELFHFFSVDELAASDRPARRRKRKARRRVTTSNTEPTFNGLTREDQEALWELYPHMTDHHPGKLSLCVGMPVLLRNNDATELCITKGQEATVVGWDSFEGLYGRQILETLFVRLINPPKDVQLADLPENVVPLTHMTANIKCKAKSDQPVGIRRQQIPVLPNFAMTDYASQGKTREYNVVDLGYSRNHQSYYTALSRSSSAEGTILIQGFSEAKITRGISGWLRQEFRELNVLDEVTCMRYEGRLPHDIHGPLRNPIIRAYYVLLKDEQDDSNWHAALRYRPGESRLKDVQADPTWDITISASLVLEGPVTVTGN